MTTGIEGYALTIGDLRQVIPMVFPDATLEQQFASRLKSGDDQALAVRITPAEQPDVEGHAFAGAGSTWINVHLDDDDTEGHAIAVHFPTAAEADRFRKRLMAVGLLAGTIAIGSAGAIAIANQPASTGSAIPANPANSITYQAPAGRGFFEGADVNVAPAAAGAAGAAAGATGAGTRGGFFEGADVSNVAPAAAGAAGAAAEATTNQTRGGLVKGADLESGAVGIGSSVERSRAAHGPVEGADK